MSYQLFENYCAGCGKSIPTPATNRRGDVPIVFCDRVCETNYRNQKKATEGKNIVSYKKHLTQDEMTTKMSKEAWRVY